MLPFEWTEETLRMICMSLRDWLESSKGSIDAAHSDRHVRRSIEKAVDSIHDGRMFMVEACCKIEDIRKANIPSNCEEII